MFPARKSDPLWCSGSNKDLHTLCHPGSAAPPGVQRARAGRPPGGPGTHWSSAVTHSHTALSVTLDLVFRKFLRAEPPPTGSPGACRAPSWRPHWESQPPSGWTQSPWLPCRTPAGTESTWPGRRAWSGVRVSSVATNWHWDIVKIREDRDQIKTGTRIYIKENNNKTERVCSIFFRFRFASISATCIFGAVSLNNFP